MNFFCYLFCVSGSTVKVKNCVLSPGKINPAGYKVGRAQSLLKAMGFKLKHVDLGFGCLLVNSSFYMKVIELEFFYLFAYILMW